MWFFPALTSLPATIPQWGQTNTDEDPRSLLIAPQQLQVMLVPCSSSSGRCLRAVLALRANLVLKSPCLKKARRFLVIALRLLSLLSIPAVCSRGKMITSNLDSKCLMTFQ
eukprot:NODE_1796_length_589_cov_0.010204.p2 type:complete len:111 gc:universal NODE_1796_length_589_cov_0.010204:197-529(+)